MYRGGVQGAAQPTHQSHRAHSTQGRGAGQREQAQAAQPRHAHTAHHRTGEQAQHTGQARKKEQKSTQEYI